MNETEIRKALQQYPFYHIIPLTESLSTPGNPHYVPAQKMCMRRLQSLDLKGKHVLDIGCRDGLFSFAAEKMGAEKVIGIDNDLSRAATEFLIPFFQSSIQMTQMNLYEIRPEHFGLFDTVIFPGVLYHLRFPFWGLKVIRDIMKEGADLIIETPIWEGEWQNAMLFCPTGDESPYEPTSCTFFNEKGMVDTMQSLGYEVLAIDYLPNRDRPTWKGLIKKHLFRRTMRERVNRACFHCRFHGYDKSAFHVQYWEDTHAFHSSEGG